MDSTGVASLIVMISVAVDSVATAASEETEGSVMIVDSAATEVVTVGSVVTEAAIEDFTAVMVSAVTARSAVAGSRVMADHAAETASTAAAVFRMVAEDPIPVAEVTVVAVDKPR
jgi:hypothetical protein